MQIIKLPHNCSAYYMHQVSDLDNVKQSTADLIKKDVAQGPALRRISAIFATTLETNRKLVEQFKVAGFTVIAKYKSHNHGNRIVVMLYREVKRKEFESGLPSWPRAKAVKRR